MSTKLSVCPTCYVEIPRPKAATPQSSPSKLAGPRAGSISPVAGGAQLVLPVVFISLLVVGGLGLTAAIRRSPGTPAAPLAANHGDSSEEYDPTLDVAKAIESAKNQLRQGDASGAKEAVSRVLTTLGSQGQPVDLLLCHRILAESCTQLGQPVEALEEYQWLTNQDPENSSDYLQKSAQLRQVLEKDVVAALQQLQAHPPDSKPQELNALHAWLDPIHQFGLLKETSRESKSLVLRCYSRAATLSCDLRDVQGAKRFLDFSRPFGVVDLALRNRIEQAMASAPPAPSTVGSAKYDGRPEPRSLAIPAGSYRPGKPAGLNSSTSVDSSANYPMAARRPGPQSFPGPSGGISPGGARSSGFSIQRPGRPPLANRPGGPPVEAGNPTAPTPAPPPGPRPPAIKLPEIKLPNAAADALPSYNQKGQSNSVPGYYQPNNPRDSLPGY